MTIGEFSARENPTRRVRNLWRRPPQSRVMVCFMLERAVTLGGLCLALALSGCSAISAEQSREAEEFVGQLAIRDSNVPNPTGEVECGEPRDYMLIEEGYPSVFRTICRVYFDDGETDQRYKDMICIGDFELEPIAEKCYVSLPYYPDGVPSDEERG